MGILSRLTGGPSDTLAASRTFRGAGAVSAQTLVQSLRNTQLFVLFEGEQPLLVSTPEGYDVICAFTTPEGASTMQYPEGAPVSVEASWLMATVPVGCGVAIDAGTDGCRFLEPDSVGWLREEMRRAA